MARAALEREGWAALGIALADALGRLAVRGARTRSAGFACHSCLTRGVIRRGVSRMDAPDGLYLVCESCKREYIQHHIRLGRMVIE